MGNDYISDYFDGISALLQPQLQHTSNAVSHAWKTRQTINNKQGTPPTNICLLKFESTIRCEFLDF